MLKLHLSSRGPTRLHPIVPWLGLKVTDITGLRPRAGFRYNERRMTPPRISPFLTSTAVVLWFVLGAELLGSVPHQYDGDTRSVLQKFTESSGRCSSEEELDIAGYLKRETEAYLRLLAAVRLDALETQASMDEEALAVLEVTLSELNITLTEIVTTLDMVHFMFEQGPVDYAQSAPLLWLTVIKDISVEKDRTRSLERLQLVESRWPSMADVVLPKLFSRILEPKLTELLRTPRQ